MLFTPAMFHVVAGPHPASVPRELDIVCCAEPVLGEIVWTAGGLYFAAGKVDDYAPAWRPFDVRIVVYVPHVATEVLAALREAEWFSALPASQH